MLGGTGGPFGRLPSGRALKLHIAILLLAAAVPAAGQDPLECGKPATKFLAKGATHSYRFSMPEGAVVMLQRTDVSGTIGLIRLRASGPGGGGETCSDELSFTSMGGETIVEVSDCGITVGVGQDLGEGDYTLVMNVISDHANSCARRLDCAATPDGIGLDVPGEVDSYSFSAVLGEPVRLDVSELDEFGPLRVRVFGPRGAAVSGADDCDHPVQFQVPGDGQYTVLVSSCGRPRAGDYRVTFDQPGCPDGPYVTYFGIASADGFPLQPNGESFGRPVYERLRGVGMILVIEGRPGVNGRQVGPFTVLDPLPDMQMLSSRTLGDGAVEVCDILPPMLGGVPAVGNLEFDDRSEVRDAVNDLGCRFDDGQGLHLGRTESIEACTRSNEQFGFAFVDPSSRIQYCAVVDGAWAFPQGDTVLAARLRSEGEEVGMRREIVVRVAEGEVTPATRTRTRTPTRTITPSRTPTPIRSRTPTTIVVTGCVGDCDDNGVVELNELILCVNVALGQTPVAECSMVDRNGDGSVDVEEILRGVHNSIEGCEDE